MPAKQEINEDYYRMNNVFAGTEREIGNHLHDAYKRGVDVKAYHNDASKYTAASRR